MSLSTSSPRPSPSWTPLAERFESLPLILAGPILRRVEPRSVTVWVALQAPRRVTLRVYLRDEASGRLTERLAGSRETVRLGDRLHVVAVTARAGAEAYALDAGTVYCYNLTFEGETSEAAGGVSDLRSPGVLVADPSASDAVELLTYAGLKLPSFVLPATNLEQVRIFHGSCRNPRGVGRDALATLDQIPAGDYRALNQELRGDALLKLGRATDARAAYTQALAALPDSAPPGERQALQMKLDDLAPTGAPVAAGAATTTPPGKQGT